MTTEFVLEVVLDPVAPPLRFKVEPVVPVEVADEPPSVSAVPP